MGVKTQPFIILLISQQWVDLVKIKVSKLTYSDIIKSNATSHPGGQSQRLNSAQLRNSGMRN